MPEHILPERACTRCGQPVNTQTDSFRTTNPGGRVQHITCPTSALVRELPPAAPPAPTAATPAEGTARPVFLRMKEAQDLLHVSESTLRRLIRAGTLPAKRLPGAHTVLINQADLLAMLVDANDV